jgi:hypothetical protein
MNNGQPRSKPVAPGNSRPRQADAAAGADFVWPPTSADLAGCTIVPLGQGGTGELESWTAALTVDTPAPTPLLRSQQTTRRRRPVEPVEPVEVHLPFNGDLDDFAPDPRSSREIGRSRREIGRSRPEIGRAALALVVAVSLAVVSYWEFRDTRRASLPPVASARLASQPPLAATGAAAIATPSNSARTNVEEGVSLVRGMSMPEARIPETRIPEAGIPEVRIDQPRAAAIVPVAMASPEPITPPDAPRAIDASRIEMRPLSLPAPAEAPERRTPPAPEPLAVAVVDTEPGTREEDHIRTTLAQWQAAYAQLDASAAREVWPSVDIRALERAFQSLKSQQLRFDHCDLTVTGARAQAACTGEAVYVPRVGNPAPKTNAREWNFELTRSDQRWTIASARSS